MQALRKLKIGNWAARNGITPKPNGEALELPSYGGKPNLFWSVVAGIGEESAAHRIRGLDIVAFYADELTLIPESLFDEARGRIADEPGSFFTGTTNPDNPDHWLKVDYLDKIDQGEIEGARHHRFVLDDNPKLAANPQAIERIKNLYRGNPAKYRQMVLGEWSASTGLVHPIVEYRATPPMEQCKWLEVGIDHGAATVTAAVLIGWFPHGCHIIDEWHHDAEELGPKLSSELAAEMHAWATGYGPVGNWALPWDASGLASDLHRLDPERCRVHDDATVWKITGSEETGIRILNQRFQELTLGRMLTVSDTLPRFRRERGSYKWKRGPADVGDDKPDKKAAGGAHIMDAARMWAMMNSANKETWV